MINDEALYKIGMAHAACHHSLGNEHIIAKPSNRPVFELMRIYRTLVTTKRITPEVDKFMGEALWLIDCDDINAIVPLSKTSSWIIGFYKYRESKGIF